jgi:hypothetical protein
MESRATTEKGFSLRASLITAAIVLGLLGPSLALAQDPFRGPTTGAPNAAQSRFYNGGAPAATFQQRREEQGQEPPSDVDEPVITGEPFEPGEILATVGNQYILAGDVLPHVNQVIESHLAKIPPEQRANISQEQLAEQKRILVAQLTGVHIEVKILYLAFLRMAPPDQVKNILKKVDADFDKTLERVRAEVEKKTKKQYESVLKEQAQVGRLAILMKEAGAWSPGELDVLLRKYGGSIAQEKRYYAEYTLGRVVVMKEMNNNPPVSHDEMLRYYREHEENYLVPARARFEIMSTRFAKFPNKHAALEAICAMGNEVYYGASFAAIATRKSQGLNAEQGGYNDWTAQGSLASKPLDQTLFAIETGKLSQVIEDERGYHIVRVLERTEAGKQPFADVQKEISDALKQQKISTQYKTIAQKLRSSTKIWTVFDDDPLLSKAAGRSDIQRR